MLKDEEAVYKASFRSPKNQSIGELFTLFKSLGLSFPTNPRKAIEAIRDINVLYNPNSEAEGKMTGETSAVLIWRYTHNVKPYMNEDDCRIAQGTIEGVLDTYGLQEIERTEKNVQYRLIR